MAESNSKSFTRILTLTCTVRTNRFKNCISTRAYSTTRIVLTISAKATIYFYCSWYITKASLSISKFFIAVVLTFTYTVKTDRFRNCISIRAHSATRIVLTISTEATLCFYCLQYITKTGSNILKFFTITILTLTYAVRTNRFKNCISTRAHSATRIVLIIFKEATIYFYRSQCIAKAGLNVLKSLIAMVLTFTYAVRTDRFRNYISMGTHSTTRITSALSTEVIIYFNPL